MAERTHWKKMTNTNYFGSWDLEDGKDMIVRITEVRKEVITNAQGRTVLYIEGVGEVQVQDRGSFGPGIIDLHIGNDPMDSFEDRQRAVYIVHE